MSQLKSQGKGIMHGKQDKNKLPQLISTLNESLVSLLQNARSRDILPTQLPSHGLGLSYTTQHLVQDIAPAVSSSSLSSRYFGFVTGGTTPAPRLADYLVTTLDECLAVRIPSDTIATDVENCALAMLAELLQLDNSS